jgi:hypothetical protein
VCARDDYRETKESWERAQPVLPPVARHDYLALLAFFGTTGGQTVMGVFAGALFLSLSLSLSLSLKHKTPVAPLLLSLATDKTLPPSYYTYYPSFSSMHFVLLFLSIHSLLFLQLLPFFIYFAHFLVFTIYIYTHYFYLFLIRFLPSNFVNVINFW